mgnify:FL=1
MIKIFPSWPGLSSHKSPNWTMGNLPSVSKSDGEGNNRFLWKFKGKLVSISFAGDKLATTDFKSKREIIDSKWHHALFVADRNQATQLYIDGSLDSKGQASKETDLTSESPLFVEALVRIGEKTADTSRS